MALTESTENDKIEVVNKWNIQVRKETIIKKDGVELTRSFHRHVLNPDADISKEPAEVKAVCNAVWTQEVKDAYETFKAEQEI